MRLLVQALLLVSGCAGQQQLCELRSTQIGEHRDCDLALSSMAHFAGIEREVAIGYTLS
jgi:hypothetical protein